MKKIRRQQAGFTLMELLVAMIVMGVLMAIAIPNYTEYVRRTHRANARAAVQQAAQWMERVATAQGRYPTALEASMTAVEGGRYTIVLDNTSTTSSFKLIARRVATAGNSQDVCGDLTLTHTGVKDIENKPSGSSMTGAKCWGR